MAHAIEVLLDLLKEGGVNNPFHVEEVDVQTRDPGEWEPVNLSEAQRALEQAVFILQWVENQISWSNKAEEFDALRRRLTPLRNYIAG